MKNYDNMLSNINKTVYLSTCNVGMTKEDVWNWVVWQADNQPKWTFDEITGGESEFFCKRTYLELKERFKEY